MTQKKKKTHLSNGEGGTLCNAQPVPPDRILDHFGERWRGVITSVIGPRHHCKGCYRIACETGRPLVVDGADLRAARRAERRKPMVIA